MALRGIIKLTPDQHMTFSNFVTSNSNGMARAVALHVSENPAGNYNPCYIYGGRGTGKSHLVNAIANMLAGKVSDLLLGRLSNGGGMAELIERYRVVIIDDFVFGFDDLDSQLADFVKRGGQLILSGALSPDLFPPSPLAELILSQGKSADLPFPEEELKIAILKARADAENINLPDDVAHFIAGHMGGNINSLLGALKRVRACSSLEGKGINRFTAIESLKDYIWTEED